jgi:porin
VGGQSLFFYELVLKQLLDEGKITLKAGRFSASDDLNASPIYSYYLNNGIDGDIRNILFDTQSSAYPFSTWAGLAKFKPNDKYLFQAGVYQTWDNIFQSYTNGTDWTIHPDDGVIYMEQAAWTPMLYKKRPASQPGTSSGAQTEGLPGHYWLGSTYTPWTGFETFREQLHLYYKPSATPVKVGNSYGFYAHADQMVHQKYPGSTQGLTLWAASAYYPQQSISVVPFQVNTGAIYKGLWQKRPEDRTIFGLIYGKYSRDYAHMIRHENHGNLTKDRWNPRYELVLEGGHRFQLSRFAFFQPDIQWDVRPGGVGSIPNAIVAGAEAGVTF